MLFNPTVFDEIAYGPRQLDLRDVEDRVARWAREFGAKVIGHHRFSFGPFTPANQPDVCIDDLALHHRHAHGDAAEASDEDAIILAVGAHAGQTRWNGDP